MYSNMCVKIALCLALVAYTSGHVIKLQEVPLSPEGMVVEIKVRDKGGAQHPLSVMKIDINEKEKKVVMSIDKVTAAVTKEDGSSTGLPIIEDRHGIRVGTCPLGYTKRGGFCFPDDDY